MNIFIKGLFCKVALKENYDLTEKFLQINCESKHPHCVSSQFKIYKINIFDMLIMK